jgi:hypothetical protein
LRKISCQNAKILTNPNAEGGTSTRSECIFGWATANASKSIIWLKQLSDVGEIQFPTTSGKDFVSCELIKLFWGIFFLESSHHLKNKPAANEPTSQRAVTLLSQPGLYFGLLWALPLISFEKPPDFPEYSSPPVLQPFGWMDYPLFLHWSWGMTSSVHLRLFQLSISLKDECDWH